MQNEIKISIITVCRNAENVIAETVKSVINQTYQNIEYIIIDGNSSDSTLRIIDDLKGNYPIQIISEPDQGIYDAMNKGIQMSRGDYIEFLNAGDVFFNHNVVNNVVNEIIKSKAEIIYGDIIYKYVDGTEKRRNYGSICCKGIYYLSGDCINHQAIFASKKCFENNKFNLDYRICADRVWMIQIYKKKYQFKAINEIICYYSLDEESMSIKNKELSNLEAKQCIIEYFPKSYFIYLVFEYFRNNKILSLVLNRIYQILFIRNNG